MKFRIKKRIAVLAALNVISLAGFVTFAAVGANLAQSQDYNYACDRWGGDDAENYAQISCFMTESAGLTSDELDSLRNSLLSKLQDISVAAEDGQRLCPDAYSAPLGQSTVKSDISGSSQAEITAVGGDFFAIHNFKLIDGAFFTDDDIMQDGVVIDRSLAWALYGSYEVSGMNLTIDGTQFYISGVIENPQTDEEISCSGELPRAYISYDGASGFAGETAVSDDGISNASGKFKTITCYETVMPEPVEDYALQAVESVMESYDGAEVIRNNGRFGAFTRLKALKSISDIAVSDSGIIYPYWENASRIVEFKLSYIYLKAALCLIIPVLTALWLIARAFLKLKRSKNKLLTPIKLKIYQITKGKKT
jgi:hypothetical protein